MALKVGDTVVIDSIEFEANMYPNERTHDLEYMGDVKPGQLAKVYGDVLSINHRNSRWADCFYRMAFETTSAINGEVIRVWWPISLVSLFENNSTDATRPKNKNQKRSW